MTKERTNLHLTLIDGSENDAALQCLQLSNQKDWARIVAFALKVVCLQEAVAQETEYLVQPVSRD